MKNDKAGAVVHRYKVRQEKVDKAIDRKLESELWNMPKPIFLASGARQWVFR